MRRQLVFVFISLSLALQGAALHAQETTPEPQPIRDPLQPPALLRACSTDELDEAAEILAGPALNFLGLEALETENEIQIAQLAAAYDVLALGQWHDLLPQLPTCAEAFHYGTALGRYYDRNALLNIFNRVARIYRSFGEMETTSRYGQLIRDQRREMNAETSALIDALQEDGALPSLEVTPVLSDCTSAEQATASEMLHPVAERYSELGGEVDTLLDQDRIALLEQYNEFALGYWHDMFATLPQCAKAVQLGLYVGHTIDSTFIAIALTDALLMEAQYGNDEMTALLAERLAQRTNAIAGEVAFFLTPLTDDP